MKKCGRCGTEADDSARYCPGCGVEIEDYPRPGGFWIRGAAYLLDELVFLPLAVLIYRNLLSTKSLLQLIVLLIPLLLYKPLMESFFGATLGKMACGLRVIDGRRERLSLVAAYVRFIPRLVSIGMGLWIIVPLFGSPEFAGVSTMAELAELVSKRPSMVIEDIVNLLVVFDHGIVALTYRKRAIHDMMAGSYCVYERSLEQFRRQEEGA